MTVLNLIGQKFGRLTVVEDCESPSKFPGKWYSCKCDCGELATVSTQGLRRGSTKSCGCLNSELTIARNRTHGLRSHPLYETWASMMHRCYNENSNVYEYYGGRGITVCEQWHGDEGILNFIQDMGQRPEDTSLDRIDTEGGYSPENCRWASKGMQSFNRRHNGNSSSKKAGVYKFKKKGVWTGKWKAIISFNKKRLYLGTFDTEEEAIQAREIAEIKYFGNTKPTL